MITPAAALAHHSFAAYETVKTLALTGTVETFEWANPHVSLQISALGNAPGEQGQWYIESSPPDILKWWKWNKGSLKRGDRVTVVVNPMRDGTHRGRLYTVKLLNTGQMLQTKLSDPKAAAR